MLENSNSTSPAVKYFKKRMFEYITDMIDDNADDVQDYFNKNGDEIIANATAPVKNATRSMILQATNSFDMPTDAYRLIYGFLNGAIDVFPYDSLPDLCRDNITDTKIVTEELFITNKYVLPDENLEAVTAFSRILTYPYGISFSCLFGAEQVFKIDRKVEDTTGMTDSEILANELMIVNGIITNFVFNLGFIYSDIVNYLTLDAANLNYWRYAGSYAGDFLMRFWYRTSFSNSF